MSKRKSPTLVSRLGRNIAAKRKEIGLTQDRLAELVRVETETISRFERGATAPSLATLETLAAKLGVTISALLEETAPAALDDAVILTTKLNSLRAKDRSFLMDLIQFYCERHR